MGSFATGTIDPSISTRITVLENNEIKVTYFASISAATGTITVPSGATILLDQLPSGADAYVSTIVNGQPSGIFPTTSGGVTVDVSSFDALGNYTLTGTPSAYPVALIYVLKIKAKDYSNLTTANIIELEDVNVNDGTYTPTGSAEVNITGSVVMSVAKWMRINNTIVFSGRFTADPVLTATLTSFEISLPVFSDITAISDVSGTATCGAIVGMSAEIIGSIANNTAKIFWISSDINSQDWSYEAEYKIN